MRNNTCNPHLSLKTLPPSPISPTKKKRLQLAPPHQGMPWGAAGTLRALLSSSVLLHPLQKLLGGTQTCLPLGLRLHLLDLLLPIWLAGVRCAAQSWGPGRTCHRAGRNSQHSRTLEGASCAKKALGTPWAHSLAGQEGRPQDIGRNGLACRCYSTGGLSECGSLSASRTWSCAGALFPFKQREDGRPSLTQAAPSSHQTGGRRSRWQPR